MFHWVLLFSRSSTISNLAKYGAVQPLQSLIYNYKTPRLVEIRTQMLRTWLNIGPFNLEPNNAPRSFLISFVVSFKLSHVSSRVHIKPLAGMLRLGHGKLANILRSCDGGATNDVKRRRRRRRRRRVSFHFWLKLFALWVVLTESCWSQSCRFEMS